MRLKKAGLRTASNRYLHANARGLRLMPIRSWTKVDAGIFHHFHQIWVVAITNILNQRLLPSDYYALAEQQGARFHPDNADFKRSGEPEPEQGAVGPPASRTASFGDGNGASGGVVLAARPTVRVTAETDLEFYRCKQNLVAVRHVSGDELIAIVEIVSKGNKSGRKAFEDFVRKAAEFLSHQVHLLIVDLQPPTPRDLEGIHGAVWDEFAGQDYRRPADKPLTLATYKAGSRVRAFVEPIGVGDTLINMPLYLDLEQYVAVPLEETSPDRLRFGTQTVAVEILQAE